MSINPKFKEPPEVDENDFDEDDFYDSGEGFLPETNRWADYADDFRDCVHNESY